MKIAPDARARMGLSLFFTFTFIGHFIRPEEMSAMLLAVLPANIYSAIHRIDFGGHGSGPAYLLVRVPFQLFVIGWTYFATKQNWFKKPGLTRPSGIKD